MRRIGYLTAVADAAKSAAVRRRVTVEAAGLGGMWSLLTRVCDRELHPAAQFASKIYAEGDQVADVDQSGSMLTLASLPTSNAPLELW